MCPRTASERKAFAKDILFFLPSFTSFFVREQKRNHKERPSPGARNCNGQPEMSQRYAKPFYLPTSFRQGRRRSQPQSSPACEDSPMNRLASRRDQRRPPRAKVKEHFTRLTAEGRDARARAPFRQRSAGPSFFEALNVPNISMRRQAAAINKRGKARVTLHLQSFLMWFSFFSA